MHLVIWNGASSYGLGLLSLLTIWWIGIHILIHVSIGLYCCSTSERRGERRMWYLDLCNDFKRPLAINLQTHGKICALVEYRDVLISYQSTKVVQLVFGDAVTNA